MNRKILTVFLSVLIALSCLSIFGCKKETPKGETNVPSYYLALNAYSITLKENERFELDVKKFNSKDAEQEINEMEITSDTEKIAVYEDGFIVAKQKGQTAIHVSVDGLEVSCFVTVESANVLDGLLINLTTQNLYKGVSTQLYTSLYRNNKKVSELDNVAYEVSPAGAATIDENGLITANITGEITITASCVVDNQNLSNQITITSYDSYYYSFNMPSVKLATAKTYSGETNTAYTSTKLKIKRINVISGETVDVEDFEVSVLDQSIVSTTVSNGEITLTAGNMGETAVVAEIEGSVKKIVAKVITATAMASIADMDKLALAGLNANTKVDLEGHYVLINDIDYNNDVIMPIAPWTDSTSTTRTVGIEWQYRLTYNETEKAYGLVDRANVGKSGYGLTTAQFGDFLVNKVINTTTAFSGSFDGNGYAIKNGKIMFGMAISFSNLAFISSYFDSVFGQLTGTLMNIGFEGITQENPDEVSYDILSLGVERLGTSYKESTLSLTKDEFDDYYYCCSSIIGQGSLCTVKNVYVDITYSLRNTTDNYFNAALIAKGNGAIKVSNCVVKMYDNAIERNPKNGYTCAIQGASTLETAVIANNISVGAFRIERRIGWDGAYKNVGKNGNWNVSGTKTWQDLFSATHKPEVENFRSLENTIKTYDTSVWDLSNFGATLLGRPTLINGCSCK